MEKMSKKEIWKDINGYKGLYQASNLGRFKSLRFNKILNPSYIPNRKGSSSLIGFNKNLICKVFVAIRIIAELFIPNPNKYRILRCKGDKKNLHPSNWYWDKSKILIEYKHTCKQCGIIFCRKGKKIYKYCSKKCSGSQSKNFDREHYENMAKVKMKKVIAIKDDEKIIFNSIIDAGTYIKRSQSTISNVLAGRQKTCAGYMFKYM